MTILRHKEVTQMTYTPILIYYEFKKIYKEGKKLFFDIREMRLEWETFCLNMRC